MKVEDGIRDVQNGCCLNIILRYSVGRQANKTSQAMEKLHNANTFGNDVALPPPPASVVPFPLESIITLQSRKQIEDMIVEALAHSDVHIVGIGGTGGIGKTSMAEKIMNRMLTEKLVDEAVKAVVSQHVNVLEIQQKIADLVGLKLDSEKELAARAHQLRTRLKSTGRKIIVVDDIWEQLNFEEIGIPFGSDSGGCKILVTSRNKQLLNQMGAQVFAMDTLTEEDAWSLFKYKAGTCVDDLDLKPTAEKVLAECKGLPIAIVTIGGALKDQRIEVWECALDQLENAKPMDIDGVEKHVYNSLRLSYDYLKSEAAQSLFLLCCIYPEDFEISLEDLTLYGMGLNMFDRVDNLSRARNRVFAIVEKLKSCSLLLDGADEKHVKMHDVVRDVSRFIAREKKLIDEQLGLKGQSHGNCEWAFIQESAEDSNFKIGSNFQCLRLLIIQHDFWDYYINIDGFQCVEGMQELEVLYLKKISLESIDCCSKNLKTLELKNCLLKNLSFVGKLRGLEILKCKSCRKIEELPIEIGNLERLKLLDLSKCRNLKRIKAGVISRLIELEELKMSGSFKEWESTKIINEEEGEQNASLKELESLKKLTWLEIEIANIELVKEDVSLPETIVKYDIQIGGYRFIHKDKVVSSYPCLLTKHNHCFRSWIHKFVTAGEALYLNGDWSSKFILSYCFGSMVKTLTIENEKDLVNLTNTSRIFTDLREGGVFPVLDCLNLNDLPNLTHIYDGPIQNGSVSFGDLRELKLQNLPSLIEVLQGPNQNVTFNKLSDVCIGKCNDLCNLFGLEKTKDVISKLVKLVIFECEKMEEVFLIEKNEQVGKENNLTFSNLIEMEIKEMASLTTFGKGIESIEFPFLTKLHLSGCPKFKWIDSQDGCSHDEYFHYFCNKKVTFGMLKELRIEKYDITRSLWCRQIPQQFFRVLETLTIDECHNIRIFCSLLIAKNLIHLKNLSINNCNHMESVIEVKKQTHHSSTRSGEILEGFSINEENEDGGTIRPFPKLEILEFCSLKNFKTLREGTEIFELHMLSFLAIRDCPKFKEIDQNLIDGCNNDNDRLHLFCSKQVTFEMLKELRIEQSDIAMSLWCRQITPQFFRTLERLTISECDNIKMFCSLLIAKNLFHLKELSIRNCDHMESVIGVERQTHHSSTRSSEILEGFSINEENEDGGTIRPFPKLEILRFHWLKNFKTLNEGIETFELHMLHSLEIWNCPKFKESGQNQTSGCNNDNDSLHLFCAKQLPFSSSPLKYLSIHAHDNVSNLWCKQIPPCCFFQSLETLYIVHCHKLKSAFPYSVAKHLLNLKELNIWSGEQMELVVSGLENKTHEQNFILFPSLVKLSLSNLPSLEMFCERGCSLTLPSLNYMEDDGQSVYRKSTNEGVEDWNNLLRQHIMSKREQEEEGRRKKEEERRKKEEEEAETSDHSSTPILDAPTNEELHKDELHVDEVPSLSRQEFSSLTPFEVQSMPVLEQAESSTVAATMHKMTAEITCPNQLIEQQSAQHHA